MDGPWKPSYIANISGVPKEHGFHDSSIRIIIMARGIMVMILIIILSKKGL